MKRKDKAFKQLCARSQFVHTVFEGIMKQTIKQYGVAPVAIEMKHKGSKKAVLFKLPRHGGLREPTIDEFREIAENVLRTASRKVGGVCYLIDCSDRSNGLDVLTLLVILEIDQSWPMFENDLR